MRWRIPLVVALALFVAVSCDQQPVEPPADQVAQAPAFNFMNGPEYPGNSPIERWVGEGWYSVTDPEQGLRLRLFDAIAYAADGCPGLGSWPGTPDWWDYQDIWSNPDGILKSISMVNEVPIVVYPWPTTQGKTFCEFLAEDWLATGTGTAVSNDNNVFWWTGTGGNNSFGIRVRGTVTDRDGIMYNFVGNNHYTNKGLCCPPFVDPSDMWIVEMSIIETIKGHPIRNGQN